MITITVCNPAFQIKQTCPKKPALPPAELNIEIKKIAYMIKGFSLGADTRLADVVEQIATDFHPYFSDIINDLIFDALGLYKGDDYELNKEKINSMFDEIMCRIGQELNLEA